MESTLTRAEWLQMIRAAQSEIDREDITALEGIEVVHSLIERVNSHFGITATELHGVQRGAA